MGNERSRNHEAWRGIEARLGHRDSRFGKNFVRFLRVGHDLLMHRLEHHLLKLRGLGVWVREWAGCMLLCAYVQVRVHVYIVCGCLDGIAK